MTDTELVIILVEQLKRLADAAERIAGVLEEVADGEE
jgi:hypothetical protein